MSPYERSIEDAQEALAEKLMRAKGVEGVGIGRRGGSPCLKVYLSVPRAELSARIPDRFRGHPVEVTGGGPFRALSGEG